jgi:signal transduction histidine kinase
VSALPQFPLIVVAARDRAEILQRWQGERTASTAASAMFIAVIGVLCWLAVRALGRQQAAVAELRRSEERLKRESTLLQSTIENIGDGLSVFDRDGRLVAANRRFGALLDLPPDLATGAVLRDILMLQARRGDFGAIDPETEVAARLERFFSVLPAYRERTTKAGRVLQIRRHGMPGGSVVTVYADITELKAGDRQMSEARRLAEEANRAKSDFLANMSHELRTPLNAIIGFAEVIGNEVLGPLRDRRYLEYVNDIRASGLHLLSIINDVLNMSKIEAGKAELVPEQLPVARMIAAAVRVMHERAAGRGIELAADGLEIHADEQAMRQILLNLLSNAIKFSEIGGAVAVRAAAAAADAGQVVITVEDHGVGMTAEELERALQPFGQVAAGTSRAYGGVGLGLPICKGLVDAQGGTLTITSARGSGTTVRIVMPAYDRGAGPAPRAGTGASSGALPPPPNGAPGTAGCRE